MTRVQHSAEDRFEQLHNLVTERYGNVDSDLEADKYERTTTEMIQVEIIDDEIDFILCDLPDEPRFSCLVLAEDLRELLAHDDMFLGVFGLRNGEWHIIWLSPPYETMEFEESFGLEH